MGKHAIVTERCEALRMLRVAMPDATYIDLAKALRNMHPALVSATSDRSAGEQVRRALSLIASEDQAYPQSRPCDAVESARRTYLARQNEIFVEAMTRNDLTTARQAARDIARVSGVDTERPLQIAAANDESVKWDAAAAELGVPTMELLQALGDVDEIGYTEALAEGSESEH